jgi:hypothetical protein
MALDLMGTSLAPEGGGSMSKFHRKSFVFSVVGAALGHPSQQMNRITPGRHVVI